MSTASPAPIMARVDPPLDVAWHLGQLRAACANWPGVPLREVAPGTDIQTAAAKACELLQNLDGVWVQPFATGLVAGALLAGSGYAAYRIVDGAITLAGEAVRRLTRYIRARRAA